MNKPSHVHKLRRHRHKSGTAIFFCTLPDCTFKSSVALSLGKRSLCWRCEEPFIMNEYSIRLAKPHCDNCHKPKDIHVKKDEIPVIPTIPPVNETKSDEVADEDI